MSQPAVGIDLGTTFSALAVINPAGKPEIVANREGERITASAVFFQRPDSIIVGQVALDAAAAYPERLVRWVKRKMGDPSWRFECDGKQYSAVDLSAMILKKVKQDAELTLGPLTHAVVTVPAYFDEVRRKATMDAAAIAGLEILRIINEPTAAALAYAAGGQVRGKCMVYDFGGGTFDVSVVDIISPQDVRVVASEGDHELGGHDLDRVLAKEFDSFFRQHKGVGLMDDVISRHQTMQCAEQVKRKLSSLQEVRPIPLSRGAHSVNASIDRTTFERIIKDYIVRTEMLVETALSAANLKASQIDHVLLVGGSTRIPAVQQMLKKKFGKDPVKAVNPDEAVALGAAIQAGILMHERGMSNLQPEVAKQLADTRLMDVTAHSYGTICVADVHGRERLRNSIIIRKNTRIPCTRSQSYYTISHDQRRIHCTITQGEDEDPEFVNVVAEDKMELPGGRPPGREIRITYSYDSNGRMSCEFLDMESGKRKVFNLDTAAQARGSIAVPALQDADFDDLKIE
ncbi:MAG: Hsp70 family protein [Nitrospira sp.]|nr:Hsp70 family protein [Nitrospira sp.]